MNEYIEKWLRIYFKCFINAVLYYRNVYPRESFDWTSYQAFNLPRHIPINRHPSLQEYIETLIVDVLGKLSNTKSFNLRIVTEEDAICIEKYTLDFSEFRHEDPQNMTETAVFDDLRSSLNDLLAKLQKLPAIKPGSVTFEVIIDTLGLSLGHNMNRPKNASEKVEQEQDVNWVKCLPIGFDPTQYPTDEAMTTMPRIKMTSLVGCDVGPMVVHQFMERLIFPPKQIPIDVYETQSTVEYESSLP